MVKVVAKIIACALLVQTTGAVAWAANITAGTQSDVDTVLKTVRRAYPKLGVLCTGDKNTIPNAVAEALTVVGKSIRSDQKVVSQQAAQRIQSGCPY